MAARAAEEAAASGSPSKIAEAEAKEAKAKEAAAKAAAAMAAVARAEEKDAGGQAAAAGTGAEGDGAAAANKAVEPFSHHTLVALEGAAETFSAFAGLVIIDAAALHPQQAIEPSRPLRLTLARAFGRAWLQVGVWLRGWTEAWLLMGMEGRLMQAYVRHAFGRNEATFRLHQERRALCDSACSEALIPSADELERWGGHLHPEQLFSNHRRRKAPFVLWMIECMMLRTEHGAASFLQAPAVTLLFRYASVTSPLVCRRRPLRYSSVTCALRRLLPADRARSRRFPADARRAEPDR